MATRAFAIGKGAAPHSDQADYVAFCFRTPLKLGLSRSFASVRVKPVFRRRAFPFYLAFDVYFSLHPAIDAASRSLPENLTDTATPAIIPRFRPLFRD
jgi:hypothetical protein